MDPNTRALMMGAAGAGGAEKLYVEDVFQTWLYTGNGSTQTITNGIDLSGKGGLVWIKSRSSAEDNVLIDNSRGTYTNGLAEQTLPILTSNKTDAQLTNVAQSLFTGTGFTTKYANTNAVTYASWTFRKAAKFFDVVTYTGTGSVQNIAHNLGSVPGCIIVKSTSQADNWKVYHRQLNNGTTPEQWYILLDSTAAQTNAIPIWNNTAPTATQFTIGTSGNINTNGATYVAYLFAHNAGGFGDSGNDSVVSCGSFSATGSIETINLGWEPQWILVKNATGAGFNWLIVDTMRGAVVSTTDATNSLATDTSGAEIANNLRCYPTATGFQISIGSGTWIYIAIRRGPMKTPTDATKVFDDVATSAATGTQITTGFPVDWQLIKDSRSGGNGIYGMTRLTGVSTVNSDVNGGFLQTSSTAAEATSNITRHWDNTGYKLSAAFGGNSSIYWNFRRAPGFFDVVAYTGTGAAQTVSHNLGVVPELLIIKGRNQSTNWKTYYSFTSTTYKDFNINTTSAASNGTYGPGGSPNFESFSTAPTATSFSVSANSVVINNSGTNYIAYLFASCPGVSKVGTYTGTGTTLNIDCGFTAGARFVLIKRTDSSGDWYVWDTARGIVSGNDPYLLLNSTAAEDTSTDYIDPLNAGFQISSTAPAAINANGGSFIFLAVA